MVLDQRWAAADSGPGQSTLTLSPPVIAVGVRPLVVANGPNIFQMLLVFHIHALTIGPTGGWTNRQSDDGTPLVSIGRLRYKCYHLEKFIS